MMFIPIVYLLLSTVELLALDEESFPLVYSITRKNMFMLSIEKENNLLYLLVPGS